MMQSQRTKNLKRSDKICPVFYPTMHPFVRFLSHNASICPFSIPQCINLSLFSIPQCISQAICDKVSVFNPLITMGILMCTYIVSQQGLQDLVMY